MDRTTSTERPTASVTRMLPARERHDEHRSVGRGVVTIALLVVVQIAHDVDAAAIIAREVADDAGLAHAGADLGSLLLARDGGGESALGRAAGPA